MSHPKDWLHVAEEAILDHFRMNKKLITGCGYRKSAIPSRKRSPSQEYRLTERGRDRIAGVDAGGPLSQDVAGPVGRATVGAAADVFTPSVDPGEDSSAAMTGTAEESRPTPEPLSLLPEPDPEARAA